MNDPRQQSWLPELCRLPRLAAMLGLAELVVVVVALAPDGSRHWTLPDFLSASGFALWLALAVTVSLCSVRAMLSRLPEVPGMVLVVLMTGLIAGACAAIVHALYGVLGGSSFAQAVGFWRFTLGSAAMTALITALALRYFYVSDRGSAQMLANARAQADALQARIRPHFLFNSMNLIASLLRRDPDVAERAVLDLSDLFRAALGAGDGDSTLQAECELAERYLSIESLRLGERLKVIWLRDEPLPWSPSTVGSRLSARTPWRASQPWTSSSCARYSLRVMPTRSAIVTAPAPCSSGSPRVAGSGAGLRTRMRRCVPSLDSASTIVPPAGTREIPCSTAFSTSGWSTSRGIGRSQGRGSSRCQCTRRRSPRRSDSIDR